MRKISKRYRGTQKQNRTMEIYALYFGRKIQHDKKSVLSESIYKFNLILRKLPTDFFPRNR